MNIRCRLTRAVLALAITLGVFAVPSIASAGGFKVPFTDASQVGSLTLCNQHEQPITSGNLATIPFVWRAVSSARAPAGYNRATLYVFQPLQYVDPADWTGYQLTDDALFSSPAHPMAQATYADNPLLWPDASIPPYWDHMYQLRMFFSAPDKATWMSTYPAAVIRVTDKTWTLVQGGGSSCTAGKAVSVESLLLPRSETSVPKPPATLKKRGSTSSATTTTTSPTGNSTTTTSPTGNSTTTTSPTGNSTTTTSPTGISTTTTSPTGNSTTTTSPTGNSTTTTSPTPTTASSTTTSTAPGSSTTTSVVGSALGGTRSSKGGGSSVGVIGGAIAALVLAGAAALFVLRRRRLA